jgi:hypothetical protein
MTHRNIFVFAPSNSTSIDVDEIPPAASRADAKNNTLMRMVDDMSGICRLSNVLSTNFLLYGTHYKKHKPVDSFSNTDERHDCTKHRRLI